MMKTTFTILLLLVMPLAALAQQPKQAAKADKQEALRVLHTKDVKSDEAPKLDPLLLTDAEKKELGEAITFIEQSKKQYDGALSDALTAPIERMNALEVVGRLQKSFTVLQSANQHFSDLREKHKASRPDCAACEYAPDGSRLVRNEKR